MKHRCARIKRLFDPEPASLILRFEDRTDELAAWSSVTSSDRKIARNSALDVANLGQLRQGDEIRLGHPAPKPALSDDRDALDEKRLDCPVEGRDRALG